MEVIQKQSWKKPGKLVPGKEMPVSKNNPLETNQGSGFHVCPDDETATDWLLSDELIQFSGG
ncbi:MAG TPA: hypothetical protein PLS77_02650 [Anaerolineaceae bacterium]|nr:hypothetical protein [Anaerolineaceae bacterium]HOH21505.1 hypothetical protein [Anaerolineaceae bacterium]HOU45421.1 hypothetical protein [Anaerolineaceae bacterium]HQF46042.1 hypothetical protein [Anaerolineaceae bacterium]HQH34591.1 hypothetical protein [Anaerolineaceae bacterium]